METWKSFVTGTVVGAGVATIFGLDTLNKANVNVGDLSSVHVWKQEAARVYKEREKEKCVDWKYTKVNERKDNTLTIYYANESWTMWSNDINDLCAFMKDYPYPQYDYHLTGREDFAERRHIPSGWENYNYHKAGSYNRYSYDGEKFILTYYDPVYESDSNTDGGLLFRESSDYITPRLDGVTMMMYNYCDVPLDLNPVVSFEKLGSRGMGICDTTANANDRYVEITAIAKEETVLQPKQ